jgi:hypothetical protein
MTESAYVKLDKALKKRHAKFKDGLTRVDKIYHYTDFEGLRGIITSQKLWFTDYRYLNDPTELKFCKNIILNVGEMVNHNLSRDQYKILTSHFDELLSKYNVYISCFSTEANKLSLWRYYANNGTGFAIGFGKNYFRPAENQGSHDDPREPTVCKINYDKKRTERIVKGFFDEFCKISPTTLDEALMFL